MTVEIKCSTGYLIDHKQSISKACAPLPYTSIENIFNTLEPYGQEKFQEKDCPNDVTSFKGDNESSFKSRRKKRKRKRPPNTGEITALEHHEKIREKILSGIELLTRFYKWNEYFNPNTSQGHDRPAGSCCLQASLHNSKLLEAVNEKALNCYRPALYPADGILYKIGDVINRLVSNEKDDSMLVLVDNTTYILPSNSKFLLSDFEYFCKYFGQKTNFTKYNMIVIDPPWENKSVKRGAIYSCLPLWDIKKIPVSEFACDKALVVVWVTNKQKYRKFVIEELFPSWSCKFIAEWHWVKVTRKGKMVFDLDSTHKKPYEPLLIGQFGISRDGNHSLRCSDAMKQSISGIKVSHKEDEITNTNKEFSETIPEHQIICSVPCSLHSRKPPLNDIFHEYLPKDAECVELFARNLLPNWTSWGNEVLKYQHLDYFETKTR